MALKLEAPGGAGGGGDVVEVAALFSHHEAGEVEAEAVAFAFGAVDEGGEELGG